jgi:hypothetical protein
MHHSPPRSPIDEDWLYEDLPYNPGDILELMARSDADPSEMGQPNPSTVESQKAEASEETRRKPIISIHGQDVDEDEIERAA